LVCSLALLLGVALGDDQLVGAQQGESLADAAVRLVAARTGAPASRLTVVNIADAAYPALGAAGTAVKVLDTATGVVHGVVLDRAHQPLEPGALAASDRALQTAGGAVIEPALAAAVAANSPDQPVPVVIWLREPAWARPARVAPARAGAAPRPLDVAQAADAAALASRGAAVQQVVAPLLARLRAAGIIGTTAGEAPAVYASVPPALLAELRTWGDVEHIYLARVHHVELDISRPTIGADVVQSLGLSGAGVQVAQIEPGSRVSASNPYLAGVVQDSQYACTAESDHATGVAGVLRSTDSRIRGIAPGMTLRVGGSCAGTPSELNDRAAAAATWGARIFSLSYGVETDRAPTSDDRFYDDQVFSSRRIVVKSTGNTGANVSSPGLGYNVITVGNFDTGGTTYWADDAMNTTSGYIGPTSAHGDRRKPELAAPGTNIHTLALTSPWTNFAATGASFATPMVAGTAALLLERNPDLASWPEAVKAILMATAVNPLAGNPSIASHGGAGGLVAARAEGVVRHVDGDWGAQPYDCGAPSPLDVATVTLPFGQRMRAVIAWNTDPNWSGWPSQPGADLDLSVVGPTGGSVAVSSTFDNSFELVDMVATSAGDYRLRVSQVRCDSSPGGLAWAWHLTPPASVLAGPTATATRPPTGTPLPTRTPTVTATTTRTPTVTPTPTPPPNCGPPRPRVEVTTEASGGRLTVTIRSETLAGGGSTNAIQALRFGAGSNVLIDVGATTGRTGSFTSILSPVSTQTSFVLRQAAAGQAATVPLTVVDGCGDWPTVVGGGASAFNSQPVGAASISCSPRPEIAIAAAPSSPGRLSVTIHVAGNGGANSLHSLRFGRATNAVLDAGNQVGSRGNFTYTLDPGTTDIAFAVRRVTAGQPVTVPLTMTDACGDWPTFVGGGPDAF
jgi:hypothetical protein